MQEGGDRIVRRLIRGDLVRREEPTRGEGGGLAKPGAVSTGTLRSTGSDSTIAVAAPRLSATAVGQFMTSIASVSGSARSASTALR